MRSDVHFAALRSAAKVAFSVAFLTGCSSTPGEEIATSSDAVTGDALTGDGVTGGAPSVSTETPAAPDASVEEPCEDASAPVKPSCDVVIASAFADVPDSYPGAVVALSDEARACCVEAVTEKSWETGHRWNCCANVASDVGDAIGWACTPWGPPVPPRMDRARARDAALLVEVA